MVFWELLKTSASSVASKVGETLCFTEPVTKAHGATAAQKRARKEEGIARREERVKQMKGESTEELDPMLIMHEDNTAMIQVCRTGKTHDEIVGKESWSFCSNHARDNAERRF